MKRMKQQHELFKIIADVDINGVPYEHDELVLHLLPLRLVGKHILQHCEWYNQNQVKINSYEYCFPEDQAIPI
jgi:hypothetical protein